MLALQINDHLLTRTFLVGSKLSLADLVVFGVTFPATVRLHIYFFSLCLCLEARLDQCHRHSWQQDQQQDLSLVLVAQTCLMS